MPSLKILAKYSSPDEVLAAIKEEKLSSSNTVFVFPVDQNGYHDKSLYARYNSKSDPDANKAGVYSTANLLSDLGTPTLGLAVENFPSPGIGKHFLATEECMASLWKAVGAGFNVALVEGLTTADPQPNNIWNPKGKENPKVSRYYAEQLEIMQKFLASNPGNLAEDKFECEVESLKVSAWKTQKVKKMQGTPAVEVEVEENVPVSEKVELAKRVISPKLIAAYKAGLAEKALREKNATALAKDPNAAEEATNDWFKPVPAKTVNNVYADHFKQQEQDRRGKTAAAWIASVLLPPLAPLWYYLWKNAKDNELVQAVEMTPAQLLALKQTRKDFFVKSAANRPTTVIADRKKRPQKAYATEADSQKATADMDATVTYLMDKSEAKRVKFFKAAMEQKRQASLNPLSKEEYQQLYASTGESVADFPKLRAQGAPMPRLKMLATYGNPHEVLTAIKEDKLSLQNTVFVFPSEFSNSFYVTNKILYARYDDKSFNNPKTGIGNTANLLSDLGMPTLALPGKNFNLAAWTQAQSKIAKESMAGLWKALGAGFNLAIVKDFSPVNRPQYFNDKDPSTIADLLYTDHLSVMQKFLASNPTSSAEADTFRCDLEGYNAITEKRKVKKKQASSTAGAPDIDVEVEEDVPVLKLQWMWRGIEPEFLAAYKEGLAEKALQDQNAAARAKDPQAIPKPTDSWFKPAPSKKVNSVYVGLLKQQEKDRRWKTAVAWIGSILTGGLAAYPLYRWWKNAKDQELIQVVEMKPTQLVALGQFRRTLLNYSSLNKPTQFIVDRKKRPQKAYASDDDAEKAATNPEATVTFLMDKGEARRINFFKEVQQQNRLVMSQEEYAQVYEWTRESVADLPKLKLTP